MLTETPEAGRFQGQRILMLPGGLWQIPAVLRARKLGLEVVCADGTQNPPAFGHANHSRVVPLQDIHALIQLGQEFGVSAVMTDQTDFAVPIVARVAQGLGLRGLPIDVAEACTNKAIMRERARDARIPQPKFRACRSVEDVRRAIAEIGLPLFHKPVDGQSSRGVGILKEKTADQIESALRGSISESRSGEAIFESFLSGTECTVEGFVRDGKPTTLAISDKKHYADLPGVARELTYPADFPHHVLERIATANNQAAQALGIPFGITHAEFIVDAQGNPWLVEMAARGGGTYISSDIVPSLTGFDPITALISILLGQNCANPPDWTTMSGAQMRFLRLNPGSVVPDHWDRPEFHQDPRVLKVMFFPAAGTRVGAVRDDRSRHGVVITAGNDRAAAIEAADDIERMLHLESMS